MRKMRKVYKWKSETDLHKKDLNDGKWYKIRSIWTGMLSNV